MHWKPSLVVAIGVVLFFAAASAYGAEPDACSLLTSAQVSAVLGLSVGNGQHLPAKNPKVCGWNAQGSSTPSPKRVVLSVESAKTWAAKKVPVEGITKTPAPGIGDDAIYITTPPFGTGLNVKKGDLAFTVRVYGLPHDEMMAKEKTLAGEVLRKL